MTLFDALYAFFQEHRRCGDLDGAVEGDRIWMTCTCGAVDQPFGRRRLTRRLVRVAVLVRVVPFG